MSAFIESAVVEETLGIYFMCVDGEEIEAGPVTKARMGFQL